jgi:hypothetical protein
MKPWQTPLVQPKHPARGKRRNKERAPKFQPKEQNPKWVAKGHRNKSCSRAPFLKWLSKKRKKNTGPHFAKFSYTCSEIVQNTGIPPNIFIIHRLWELTSLLSAVEVLKYLDWICWSSF